MATTTRHDLRCPNCARFVPAHADGFYDRLDRDDETSWVEAFCDEHCANEYHSRHRRPECRCSDCAASVAP